MGDVPVTLSERAFGALVRALYPRAFCDRYGREMSQAFGQLCRDARHGSAVIGIPRLWMSELPALLVGALIERSTTMARGIGAVGRAGVRKAVVLANAVALVTLGGALLLWPVHTLVAYDMLAWSQIPATPPAWSGDPVLAVKMTTQALGATLVGLGIVAGSHPVRTSSGAAPHGHLAWAGAVISFGAGLILVQYPSALAWLTVVAFVALTASYAVLWVAGGPRSRTVRHGRNSNADVTRDPARV